MTAAKAKHWIAGTLAGVLSMSSFAVAQETIEEKAPYVQIIEDLEKDLNAALLKNDDLELKVKNLSSAMGVLAERESETKKELEELRESHQKAVVNLELFSVALQRGGEDLQDLLIKAASDLRLAEKEQERVSQGLLGLMSAVEDYLQSASSDDAEARLEVERALREGEETLGLIVRENRLQEKTIDQARVITVNKEFNLVLVDVGQREGLRVGTPVSLHRKDRTVGTALVIDVREIFSGAILLELSDPNDQIMVGDTMRVDPDGV